MRDLHQTLLTSSFYPEQSSKVEFLQTHISNLYLTDSHVYKLKKPVDFGFLDFTSLDRRRFYCEEEVRLNQALCPDTYLGVEKICQDGETYHLGGPGQIVDYMVRMNRLPAELMLDRMLLDSPCQAAGRMVEIGETIAAFHRQCKVVLSDPGEDEVQRTRKNWLENFEQCTKYCELTISEKIFNQIRDWVQSFIEIESERMSERQNLGLVREGHGDLHVEHVCLTEPLKIFDCIEFNRRFRTGDVLSDLAFLLMDLEYRDQFDMARVLEKAYLKKFPEAKGTRKLLRFYKTYRAWVRGKVESMLGEDQNLPGTEQVRVRERAKKYFRIAHGYCQPPMLILTSGYMGTGKTTLAGALAPLLQATVISTDRTRKNSKSQNKTEAYGEGRYSRQERDKVYASILDQCRRLLQTGQTVIVDASFDSKHWRELFTREARHLNIACHMLSIQCPPALALERLAHRQGLGENPSEGRPELLQAQIEQFEPHGKNDSIIFVDSSQTLDYNVDFTLYQLHQQTAGTT